MRRLDSQSEVLKYFNFVFFSKFSAVDHRINDGVLQAGPKDPKHKKKSSFLSTVALLLLIIQ